MSNLESCIDFLQRLIRTESLPGCEGDIANLVRRFLAWAVAVGPLGPDPSGGARKRPSVVTESNGREGFPRYLDGWYGSSGIYALG